MLGTKAGLKAVGDFVGRSWAATRRGLLKQVPEGEGSGNGRSGKEDLEREEEDLKIDDLVGGRELEEREEERWLEWRKAMREEE